MRKPTKIALSAAGIAGFLAISAAGAFLIGHAVGTNETLTANRVLRGPAEAAVAAGNMTKTAYDGWSLVCRGWSGDQRRCVLFMAVADTDLKQVLLTFAVTRTPQGMPVLIVDTPPGTDAGQGVTVKPGTVDTIKVGIRSCGPQRCRAVTELSSSLRAALEAAETTSITYVSANKQPSTYNLPTRGFREGLAAWFAEVGPYVRATAAVN
jgi:invasion protein IalB